MYTSDVTTNKHEGYFVTHVKHFLQKCNDGLITE